MIKRITNLDLYLLKLIKAILLNGAPFDLAHCFWVALLHLYQKRGRFLNVYDSCLGGTFAFSNAPLRAGRTVSFFKFYSRMVLVQLAFSNAPLTA